MTVTVESASEAMRRPGLWGRGASHEGRTVSLVEIAVISRPRGCGGKHSWAGRNRLPAAVGGRRRDPVWRRHPHRVGRPPWHPTIWGCNET